MSASPESAIPESSASWAHPLAVRLAVVGGIFALVAGYLLYSDYRTRLVKDPLDAPHFRELKKQLAMNPKDEVLKDQVRRTDQQLREEYFRQRSFSGMGALLMWFAVATACIAARIAATLKRRLPMPTPQDAPQDPELSSHRIARWSIGGMTVAVGVAAVVLSLTVSTPLARSEGELSALLKPAATAAPVGKPEQVAAVTGTSTSAVAAPAATADFPSPEEWRKNWPRFRGPDGLGISEESGIPTEWNAAGNKAILWKAAVPVPGNNSPIVWGDKLFVSGAEEKVRKVFCYDAAAGKLLWESTVPSTPQTPAQPPKISGDTGFAASTMTTDGRRVYAVFANGDIAAFDFQGKPVWNRSLGLPHSEYGHASSLAMYQNRVLMQFDQGEKKDNLSKLIAFDAATGKTVWETPRPVPNSWPTPLVFQHAGRDLIATSADPFCIVYAAADGKEVWRVKCLRQDVGPSPVYANGMVYVASEFPQLSAIKADGTGDVTATNIAWVGEDGLPDTTSPLATTEYVFLLSSPGTLTAYDAKTGKKLWEKDFEGQFKASPTLIGKNLYLMADDGKAYVVEPSRSGAKDVGKGDIGEKVTASPAVHAGKMYLRGEKSLFCIGNK